MATAVRARWAITGVFGGNGLLIASLAVRTPSLQLDLGLTTGQLGLLSGLFGISAVIAMQSSGRLAARFGSAGLVTKGRQSIEWPGGNWALLAVLAGWFVVSRVLIAALREPAKARVGA